MEVNLRVKMNRFNEIKQLQRSHIDHGYSKNKKYQRLFKMEKNQLIKLLNEDKSDCIEVRFKKIFTQEKEGKKTIVIIFEL